MTISGMTSYTLSKPWKKKKIEIFNLLSTKLYVGKNKKSDKIEQMESSTKLKIRQNWKLDELENWMKLKIGWDWNLGEIEKKR